ncbi:hypothetical protein HMPREF9440_01109 [Sutterella parvirubra YIT 11816]|uniref:Uncharacterized protein n=1 Tax=Sutterella parvirubra YIT 11816 TaxID=762967 RepID=H3KEE5_9BURK|nr:hypothetical protein HMPREF9440_01109 [Sutterella parvirubra YIT 11816]
MTEINQKDALYGRFQPSQWPTHIPQSVEIQRNRAHRAAKRSLLFTILDVR